MMESMSYEPPSIRRIASPNVQAFGRTCGSGNKPDSGCAVGLQFNVPFCAEGAAAQGCMSHGHKALAACNGNGAAF
jgi:hypothetical protein